MRLPARIFAALWLAVLAACTTPQTQFVQTSLDVSAYRPFLAPGPLLPFRATGSMRFTYAGETESGEFILFGSAPGAYRFQMLTRLAGSLVLEFRFDEERMLLLDYTHDTYFLGANNRENRERWIELDITPPEFLMMVTGRVSESAFAGAGGEWLPEGQARMARGEFSYTFWLDGHGLPRRWSKQRAGRTVYRVEYRDYLSIPLNAGAPLRLPRKLRVYTKGERPALVLGVREFLPGAESASPLDFELPPGREWRFTPRPGG